MDTNTYTIAPIARYGFCGCPLEEIDYTVSRTIVEAAKRHLPRTVPNSVLHKIDTMGWYDAYVWAHNDDNNTFYPGDHVMIVNANIKP